MPKTLKISEARKRLFDLVDAVTSDDAEIVFIERRDDPKRAALVSEDHLRELESRIAALVKERASDFTLAGSMRLVVAEGELDAALDRARADQAALASRKLRDL